MFREHRGDVGGRPERQNRERRNPQGGRQRAARLGLDLRIGGGRGTRKDLQPWPSNRTDDAAGDRKAAVERRIPEDHRYAANVQLGRAKRLHQRQTVVHVAFLLADRRVRIDPDRHSGWRSLRHCQHPGQRDGDERKGRQDRKYPFH